MLLTFLCQKTAQMSVHGGARPSVGPYHVGRYCTSSTTPYLANGKAYGEVADMDGVPCCSISAHYRALGDGLPSPSADSLRGSTMVPLKKISGDFKHCSEKTRRRTAVIGTANDPIWFF